MLRFRLGRGARLLSLVVVMAPVLAGCSSTNRLVLTADDVITLPDGKAVFAASVLRDYGSPFHKDIVGAQVTFLVDGKPAATGITNQDGRLVITGQISPRARSFAARTRVDGQDLDTWGSVYRWSTKKTIIAVDVDETISATSYSDLFFAELDGSKPIKGAAAALWSLARDYQILYISARPDFLQEKTRHWLRENRFPPAPYMGADRFEACLHQEAYKRRILERVKAHWPNLLIGIGDKKVDDGAYGSNAMLTFIVNPMPLGFYSQRCVMMRDWQGLTRFFEAHSARLSDPATLAGVIQANGTRLRLAFAQPPPAPAAVTRDSVAAANLRPGVDPKQPASEQRVVQAAGAGF